MKLHVKSRNRGRASNDGFVNLLDPVMQVVVLPSPAVERIGVAVHVDELLLGDGSHTAKVVVVLESVVPLVDGHAQVLGVVLRTAVEIPVIKQKILIVRTIRMYKKITFHCTAGLSLAGLDSTNQEILSSHVCSKDTESKPVKLEASRTYSDMSK